jgi:uncharacterized LabA/DUF88 family protein
MSRLAVYVDGESHFHRSEARFAKSEVKLDDLPSMRIETRNPYLVSCPSATGARFLVRRDCKLFWDSTCLYWCTLQSRNAEEPAVIYFTAFSGDPDALHSTRAFLRQKGFEPVVLPEPRSKAKRRDATRRGGMIEKAKGVDIELTVRILEDARANVFEKCCIFTSDEDYVPVVRSLKRLGKVVYVAGYKSMLATNSEFEFIPDKFIDFDIKPLNI